MENFIRAMDAVKAAREATGVDINGKKYSMVKDRVDVFRRHFGDQFGIETDVGFSEVPNFALVAIARAFIKDTDGKIVASGTAMEEVGTNEVTRYSPLESAETKAIGRALAAFGLHGGEYASDHEMARVADRREEVVQEDERQHFQPEPVQVSSVFPAFFIPNQWYDKDPWELLSRIADSVVQIRDRDQLAEYWSALVEFRQYVQQRAPDVYNEMKQAFQSAAGK